MWLRPGVGVQPRLVGLEGNPIDEAGMMVGKQNRPLLEGKMTYPFLDGTMFIDVAFVLGFAVGVSASIHRIGEDMVNGRVSRSDPAERTRLASGSVLQRKRQSFRAEPEPHATRGTKLGKTLEDGADGTRDGLVGMKQDLPILFSPNQADRQAAA